MASVTTPLSSSWLTSVTYDDETQEMEVSMRSGISYSFAGVPQSVYDGFVSAASPGEYYHRNIRGRYAA